MSKMDSCFLGDETRDSSLPPARLALCVCNTARQASRRDEFHLPPLGPMICNSPGIIVGRFWNYSICGIPRCDFAPRFELADSHYQDRLLIVISPLQPTRIQLSFTKD